MKFLALIALVFTLNAHATGGFDCAGLDADGNTVEVYATTGRVPGNPIVGDVKMTRSPLEIVQIFPKTNIVGYWNMGKKLKLAIVDANAENIVLKLKVKFKKNSEVAKGTLTLNGEEKIKVVCNAE